MFTANIKRLSKFIPAKAGQFDKHFTELNDEPNKPFASELNLDESDDDEIISNTNPLFHNDTQVINNHHTIDKEELNGTHIPELEPMKINNNDLSLIKENIKKIDAVYTENEEKADELDQDKPLSKKRGFNSLTEDIEYTQLINDDDSPPIKKRKLHLYILHQCIKQTIDSIDEEDDINPSIYFKPTNIYLMNDMEMPTNQLLDIP